jgi:hypothetical protein
VPGRYKSGGADQGKGFRRSVTTIRFAFARQFAILPSSHIRPAHGGLPSAAVKR